MADVLYDRSNLPLLEALQRIAPTIIVADSRVAEIPAAGFRLDRTGGSADACRI